MNQKFGKVHVNTGDGHGKTTSALGIALRALGHGYKVCIVQFLKGRENTGEFIIQKKLKPNLSIYQFGNKEFIINKKSAKSDEGMAQEGLKFAKNILKKRECDILILDEIIVAVYFGLIKEEEVLDLIKNYRNKNIEIILTGRNATKNIINAADIVTDMKKIKHYYDKVLEAREGIEF